jgi:tetratricopeptide (TPR) repeat protein
MREAASAAWDRNWDGAIKAYMKAVQNNPNDAQSMAGLALSFMEARRYNEAIQTYERVSQLVPSDPLPLEKMAEIYEIMQKPADAAKKYHAAGEIYFARRDINKAVPYWEQAISLDAELAQAHMRLAQVYEQNPQTKELAIYEYLALARLLQKFNQGPKAEQSVQRAMTIDQLNNDVRSALSDLKAGKQLQAIKAPSKRTPSEQRPKGTGMLTTSVDVTEPPEDTRAPADEAAHTAQAVLADLIWSGEVPPTAMEALVQAIEQHQIGAAEEAIVNYNAVITAGVNHPALNFNLGLLYLFLNEFDQGAALLEPLTDSPEYGLASALLLGQAVLAQNQVGKAARYMVTALQRADAMMTDHVDHAGFERLMVGLDDLPEDYHKDFSQALSVYLEDPHWRRKLRDTLNGFAAQGKTSYVADLVELVMEGGRPEMAALMERIDLYLSRDMTRLALEEIYYAIEKSPEYLPAHRRMADILIKQGQTQDAATKITLVADTYIVRGNFEKAADLYAEVLNIWPADMDARITVINMLKDQGRVNDAIRQYNEMADFYFRLMADPGRATQVYQEALAYANANNAAGIPVIPILKSLADIESQQLNWKKALDYYDQVRAITPDDIDTTLAVVDLNFQMGQSEGAITALDGYIRYCITSGKLDGIVPTLEEQVRRYPNEVGVRQRLAEVYRQQKRIPDAIAQMDAVGEMLLETGHRQEAADAIRKIIELEPPDIEGYRQLLAELESGGS